MNNKLIEMNQRYEKNEKAEKDKIEVALYYYSKLLDWDKKVEALDIKDERKECELEEELEELVSLENLFYAMDEKIEEEDAVIQKYFQSISDPNYGDYDLKNLYLTMDSKKDKGTLIDSYYQMYRRFNEGVYTLHPYQYFHNRRHGFVRLVKYLFSKGIQEFLMVYTENSDTEKEVQEMIYPDLSEKDWHRICDLIVDMDSLFLISNMNYKGEKIQLSIFGDGKLNVDSTNELAFHFNEVLEHMEDVKYENIRNYA